MRGRKQKGGGNLVAMFASMLASFGGDKSISARQWKKQVKAKRREAKCAAR